MDQNESRISKMDALLFALIFEVVLLQMRILEGSIGIRLRNWRPMNKAEMLQYEKLSRDRKLVSDVMRKTIIELVEDGEWDTIKQTIEELKQKKSDVSALRLTNQQLNASRNQKVHELNFKRNQWAMELKDADEQTALLRDKMSDELLNAITRLSYAEHWLFAGFEALEIKYDVPRPPKPRTDHEDRVHSELLRAFEIQIKELEESLEYWHKRYETDTEVITAAIEQRCEELRDVTNKRMDLEKTYNVHEGEMRGWLTFKQERAARIAREERQRKSATLIQAWWRGIMVRRALGQFKFLRNVKKSAKGKKK